MVTHEQTNQLSEISTIIEDVQHGRFPYDETVLFRDSSFFKKSNAPLSLPSPTEVREVASQSTNPNARLATRLPPVSFPNIGLLVKYGTEVTLASYLIF
jgi:hypothetical protein